MSALLKLENICVSYDHLPVLRDISIELAPREILGIVGESGSGKSTTIYASMGILKKGGQITGGTVTCLEQDLLKLKKEQMRKLRGSEMTLIAQNPIDTFHPIRKLSDQLKEYANCHEGLSYKEAEERILEIMDKINLKDGRRILNSYAFELSGGMCQRVAIAFAMVFHPKLLFADEPTSALDVTVQNQVVRELMNIREDYQTAILMVSHNMGVISHMSDRIVVMFAGMVVEEGNRDDIIRHALHPYTKNLIRAVPKMHRPAPKDVISFQVDRMTQRCPIYDNCKFRKGSCNEHMPAMTEVTPGHFVRCHYVEDL